MLRRFRGHVTYANVTATLALFFALAGGSAYAINEWNSSNIQNETLLSEDIKNGTLKAADYGIGSVSGARIQDNNVTTLDLADGAIFGNDVRDGSLTGADVADGSLDSGDIGVRVVRDLNIGIIPATNCVSFEVDSLGATHGGDLLLTLATNAHPALVYSVRQSPVVGRADIVVCNFAGAPIDDGETRFYVRALEP